MVQAFEKLHTISAEGLERNIVQHDDLNLLQAGENQFASFWTRDFCWSVPGLLCLGKTEVVKNHVTYLLDSLHVEKNTVPRLLDFGSGKMRVVAHTVGRSLGLPVLLSLMKKGSTLTPEYYGEHSTSAVDGNLLTLIASAQYILHSGDNVWLIQNSQKLQDCYRHYANLLDEEGLIVQPAFSDWQDSLSREGRTTYTNLLHFIFLSKYKTILDIDSTLSLEKLKSSILKYFSHESGILKTKEGSSVCDIDSNLLALSCEESFLSWDMFKQNGLSNQTDSPAPVSYAHEEERVSWTCRGIGLSGYHKTLVWSWLVAELAKVAALSGDRVTAEKYLMFLESCALRDGTVAEIYEPQRPNKMFQTLFYKSEGPFSWGCAKTIEAIEVYRKLYPISRDIPYES